MLTISTWYSSDSGTNLQRQARSRLHQLLLRKIRQDLVQDTQKASYQKTISTPFTQISYDNFNQVTIKQALIQLSQIQSHYENDDSSSMVKLIKIHTKLSFALMMHYIG